MLAAGAVCAIAGAMATSAATAAPLNKNLVIVNSMLEMLLPT
jgi:hypothetical protein